MHESGFASVTVQTTKEILRYFEFVRKYCDVHYVKLLDVWGENKIQITVSPKVIRVESEKSFGNVPDRMVAVSVKQFKNFQNK